MRWAQSGYESDANDEYARPLAMSESSDMHENMNMMDRKMRLQVEQYKRLNNGKEPDKDTMELLRQAAYFEMQDEVANMNRLAMPLAAYQHHPSHLSPTPPQQQQQSNNNQSINATPRDKESGEKNKIILAEVEKRDEKLRVLQMWYRQLMSKKEKGDRQEVSADIVDRISAFCAFPKRRRFGLYRRQPLNLNQYDLVKEYDSEFALIPLFQQTRHMWQSYAHNALRLPIDYLINKYNKEQGDSGMVLREITHQQ